MVLAGAGSGKTRVITRKISYLIRDCGINANHITAVTFTNKAAREMKARVGDMLARKESRGLIVSTFHNLGLRILKTDCKHLDYKPGFSIFDTADTIGLIKGLMGNSAADGDADMVRWRISRWKNDFILPPQALQQAENEVEQRYARMYEGYQRQLHAYNAMDFDDLILQPVRLFLQHQVSLEKWQQRMHYLLVDEYQDTNASQYEMVKLLLGHRARLTAVGDDDQSIYAWSGARPETWRSCRRIIRS